MAWRLVVQFGDSVVSRDFSTKAGAVNALAVVESAGHTVDVNGMTVKYYPSSIMQVRLFQVEST